MARTTAMNGFLWAGSVLLSALVLLAGCASSGDVEQARRESEQAKAKMRAELQQERALASSMEKESEAQKAKAEKLAKALGGGASDGKALRAPTVCPPNTNPHALAIQVVNDSDQSDSDVYLLLTGKGIGWPTGPPNGLSYLDIGSNPTGSAAAKPVSKLPALACTVISPYTGRSLQVYQFSVAAISGGRLMVSYKTPVAVSNGNFPTGTESFRWDKMEFGYPGSGADLTSMDFFGIPMQFDYLDGANTVLNTMTYYASTGTILNQLYGLSPAMGQAFQAIGSTKTGTWTPSQGLTQFSRVMGPSLLASASSNGSPAPYPSFGPYLTTLVGQPFTVSGAGNAGCPNAVPYTYSASFASDGKGGYVVTLTGATNGTPCGITPGPNPQTVTLPQNLTVTVKLPAPSKDAGYDVNLYGAPATAFSVPTTGMTSAQIRAVPNSLYAVIAGDFMAGINFGYVGKGSNAPQNSANWYSNPPILYPFGGARKKNDGHYNAYAAVFYNLSDAYGFAYSDRGGRPSPYVPLPSNVPTMRITILNDNRLNAPQVTVSNPTSSSLTISWPAVSGATGYTVNISYGGGIPVPGVTLTPAMPSPSGTTISGLSPGTTYQISATATGTNNDHAIQSYVVPVYGTTAGALPSLTGGSISFGTGLNWSVGTSKTPPSNYTFAINGSSYTVGGSQNAAIAGAPGINVYGLTITNGTKTLYQGNYVVNLTSASGQYYVENAFLTPPNSNLLTTAWSKGGGNGFPAGPFPNNGSLVIGTPFAPVATKQTAPVVFPTP
ncbi:MAG: hypothetical protein AB1411_13380 [Nitrospirota bacterium]